jgi:hypothetical protein
LIPWAYIDTSASGEHAAALKELGVVDIGVDVDEDVVQLHRSFAWSVANYSCRKVGGDRSHAGPRPFMNSSANVKVTDLVIDRDSSMWFILAAVHTVLNRTLPLLYFSLKTGFKCPINLSLFSTMCGLTLV